MLLQKVVSLAVPVMVATAAFLHAQAIGALVDATATPKSIAPFAEARAAESPAAVATKSAAPMLSHNVFDHLTPKLETPKELQTTLAGSIDDVSAGDAPACEGVRTIVTVNAATPDASFAALDVGGKRHFGRRGTSVEGLDVVFVGADRVWLRQGGTLCQALVFAGAPAVTGPAPATGSPLEQEIGKQIAKVGPTSYAIDRNAVSRIIEAQAELMRTPMVPEKADGRVVGYKLTRVKPGSVTSMLGLESGDRLEALDGMSVANVDGLMQAYAKLSTGTLERMTIQITRAGKPMTLDYAVK